jgi:hypothetical protein
MVSSAREIMARPLNVLVWGNHVEWAGYLFLGGAMSKEAMKLALKALYSMKETLAEHDEPTTFNEDEAIEALEEALAKQEQGEPVYGIGGGLAHDAGSGSYVLWDNTKCNPIASPREQARKAWEDGYASAKRTWVGLTLDERKEVWLSCEQQTPTTFAQAIETKLKEKNT